MGVYRTIKCPYCKGYLKFFENDSKISKLGAPIIRCQNCSQLVRTGKKLWRDMSFLEKLPHYAMLFVSWLFGSSIISVIITLLIIYFQDLEFSDYNIYNNLKYIIIPISIIIFFRIKNNTIQHIQLLENDFDKGEYTLNDF